MRLCARARSPRLHAVVHSRQRLRRVVSNSRDRSRRVVETVQRDNAGAAWVTKPLRTSTRLCKCSRWRCDIRLPSGRWDNAGHWRAKGSFKIVQRIVFGEKSGALGHFRFAVLVFRESPFHRFSVAVVSIFIWSFVLRHVRTRDASYLRPVRE